MVKMNKLVKDMDLDMDLHMILTMNQWASQTLRMQEGILFYLDEMKKLKEQREQGLNEKTDGQIFQDVLGKDTRGYLRAYGPGKSITKHFQVKPLRIDLHQEVVEAKKAVEKAVQEEKHNAKNVRKEAEDARKEAGEARKDAEFAKNEAERTRNEVDQKIAPNNKVWKNKFKHIVQTFRLDTYDNDDSWSDGSSA